MVASVDSRVVKRYAGAIFELAQKHGDLDQTSAGLRTVRDAFKNSPQLMVALLHPRVSPAKKEGILRRLFGSQFKSEVLHLLLLMVRKDRTAQIPYIAAEFDRLLQLHRKQADGEVISAVPLNDTQTNLLVQQLHDITGFKVNLQKQVNPSLLGGLVVRVGDHMIDNSVANKLNLLKERFKQVKVV